MKMFKELVRYTVVGGVAFCIDFFLLYALTEWGGLHYLYSATVAFSVGLICNYILCIVWVFSYRSCSNKQREFFLFLSVGIGGLILTDVLLAVVTPLLQGNYLVAKGVSVFFVYLWNFFARRQLLFVNKRKPI